MRFALKEFIRKRRPPTADTPVTDGSVASGPVTDDPATGNGEVMVVDDVKRLTGPRTRHRVADSLLVLEGAQAGSRATLSRGRASSVGSDLDSDVVLRAGGGERLALSVSCLPDGWTLEVIEGEAMTRGLTLSAGQRETLAYGTPVIVSRARFTLEKGCGHEAYASPAVAEEEAVTAMSAGRFGTTANVSSPLRVAGLACLVGGVLMLILGVAAHPSRGSGGADEPRSLEQRLHAEGFGHLSLLGEAAGESGDGSLVLTGVVRSSQREMRLRELVAMADRDVVVDVQVDTELAEAIAHVYRVNGVDADVTITGLGRAEVSTRTADIEALDRIEQAVRADLPRLAELETSNVVPVVTPAEPLPNLRDNPDKKITLVVAGKNGYLMTRDGSRYFVGSTLPSGHVIRELANGQVIVTQGDKEVTLEF